MCHQHGHGRITIGRQGRTPIEPEPAHPQHAGTGNGHGHVVRHHALGGETFTVTQHHSRHQRCHTGSDVHHGTAGKVIQPQVSQPAAAPDPVTHRDIHPQQPEHGKRQHRPEAHALGKSTDDQGWRNDGKGHLEQPVQAFRQGAFQRLPGNPGKEHMVQATDPGIHAAAIGKRQGITADQPHQRHRAGNGETLHQNGQNVLGAHQAAVEQAQARQRHEQHQRGGGENPGTVTGIQAIGQRQRRQHQQYSYQFFHRRAP